MPRNDLLEQSAPRAELDQRSREARLRLQQVERLLATPLFPRQSLLRRVLHSLRSRTYVGRQTGRRSASPNLTGNGEKMPNDTGRAADGSSAAPPAMWQRCALRARLNPARPNPAGFRAWPSGCARAP